MRWYMSVCECVSASARGYGRRRREGGGGGGREGYHK